MKYEFDPTDRFIQANQRVSRRMGTAIVVAALDTGASGSVLGTKLAAPISGTVGLLKVREVNTAGGAISAYLVTLAEVSALGRTKAHLEVLMVDFPETLGVDALLGADLFSRTILTLDFQNGHIEVIE